MKMIAKTCLTVVVALMAPVPLLAQDALVLTIDAAIERGLAEAPRLAEARSREAAADAAVVARAALGRPAVAASSGYLRTNHVDEFGVGQPGGGTLIIFPDVPDNYRARAELSLPIYTSGRVGEQVASAEATRRAVGADSRTVSADLKLEIVAAYYRLLTARERVRVLERALERSDANLETVRARVDSGVLPPNDVLSAEAQRARQNVQLIQARNDAVFGEADLARLVGAEAGRPLVLATAADQPLTQAVTMATLPVADILSRARQSRPERQAMTERQTSFRATADAAQSAVRPQVSALVAVEPARPHSRFVPRRDVWNTGWDLGVNATWTLFDGGRARAEQAGAVAEADALQHRIDDFDATLAVELRQRLLDLASGRAALEASDQAVTAAAEARRVLGERFLVGVATNTEVLDADVAWLEAELEHTRLQASLRLSEARLVRTAGDK
jgi:OMF family outer membrane factor